MATRTLKTAEERREAVLVAAIPQFAKRGYYGTPTTDIARDAGISQAYVFRLFPTKQALFIAVADRCMDTIRASFERAAAPHAGDMDAAFDAMGSTYSALLEDRDLLLIQLHSYAACEDPVVRAAVQAQYGRIVETVRAVTNAPEDRLTDFFSTGMFLAVMTAMRATDLDLPWAQALMGGLDKPC